MQNNLLKNIVRDFAKSSATTSTIALIGSILGLGLVGVSPAGAVTFGTNLIINGDAEESVGLIPTIGAVSGWIGIGTLTSIPYGTDGFPTSTDPGPANRANITGLLETSSSGLIPVGTRRISVQLAIIGTGLPGSYNDGYVDNLSLVLTDVNATAASVMKI